MTSKNACSILFMYLVVQITSAQTDSLTPTTVSDSPVLESRRIVKRNDLRTILSRSIDPNFWPARGRRSDLDFPSRFFASRSEESSLSPSATVMNRGRKTNDEETGVFWAGRGRSIEEDPSGTFWAGRGRSLEEEPTDTFWAGRGRSLDDDTDGTFWAGRGRSFGSDPAEIGVRSLLESEPIDTFWANRGRALEELNQNHKKGEEENEIPGEDEMDTRLRRHRLFVEEPGWVWMNRRDAHPSYDVSFMGGSKPFNDHGNVFWVARGKKHKKEKREIKSDSCQSFPKRNAKNLVRELPTSQNHFWPLRGKRPISNPNPEINETPFWSLRRKKEASGRI